MVVTFQANEIENVLAIEHNKWILFDFMFKYFFSFE